MAANGAQLRLQSQVQCPNRDEQTTSHSTTPSPRRGTTPRSSHSVDLVQEQAPLVLHGLTRWLTIQRQQSYGSAIYSARYIAFSLSRFVFQIFLLPLSKKSALTPIGNDIH